MMSSYLDHQKNDALQDVLNFLGLMHESVLDEHRIRQTVIQEESSKQVCCSEKDYNRREQF